MHNTIAHLLLTDAQSVPEEQLPPQFYSSTQGHMLWSIPLDKVPDFVAEQQLKHQCITKNIFS